jgi:transmembrane sensor
MNPSDKKNIKDIYLAKWLSGELTDKELKSFVSANDIEVYIKIKNSLELFESPKFDGKKLQKRITDKINKKEVKVKKLPYKWFYVAATISAIIISTYLFTYLNPTIIKTKTGENRNITLLDGSEVKMNAKSIISYSKKSWKTKRQINLEGEAYFNVKNGKNFSVTTEHGIVTAIGTKFNVNSQYNFFNVKCYEGKVRIVQNNDTLFLSKGMAYQYNNKKIDQWSFENETPSWLRGESNFNKVPLYIVIKSLENQFDIKIIDKNIEKDHLFSGSFYNDSLEIALKSVFLPMEIDYEIKNKTIFLSKK